METTILLVDDHPLFRKGLRLLLQEEEDIRLVGEAGQGREAMELVRKLSPDVVVMDITMPDLDGIEATRNIISESPGTKVIALSIHSGKRFIEGMLRAGASGYILKESSPEELLKGIRAMTRGEVYLGASVTGIVVSQYVSSVPHSEASGGGDRLTTKEREMLRLVVEGNTIEQIAARLDINAKTVESKRRRLMKKLDMTSEGELAAFASAYEAPEKSIRRAVERKLLDSVIRTKLHPPAVTPDFVPRPRLVEMLERHRNQPLTLISAAAGYGKTTLASDWLRECDRPGAWLSLDEDDNDLRQFLAGFLAAVRTMFPDEGENTRALLDAPDLPSLSVVIRHLLNDLEEIEKSFILVVDDYHLIHEREVHDLVAGVLEHPPQTMHLVLLTRRDPPLPVSTLRGRGMVHEIATGALRFTPEETAAFLLKALDMKLDGSTAALVEEQIEGWPAGLRLVAHSVKDSKDLGRILGDLPGDFRSIVDYLGSEVLSRQPPAIRNLLLQTCILDRFCASLCEAVCLEGKEPGEEEISGPKFMEWLKTTNLFLVPLDGRGHWYRYHNLFQRLLLNTLEQRFRREEIAALHSRAAAWFDRENMIDEALDHAIRAGEVIIAAQIAERHRQAVFNDDQWYVFARWLSRFPEDIVQQHPGLLMGRAWVRFHHCDISGIPSIIDSVASLVGSSPEEAPLRGEIDFFRGYICYLRNEGLRSLKHLEDSLDKIPEEHSEIRGQVEVLHGLAEQMQGRKQKAVDTLHELLGRRSPAPGVREIRHLTTLTYIHIIAGELDEALAASRRLYEHAAESRFEYAKAWSAYLSGLVRFYRNDLNSAMVHLERSIDKRYIFHARAAVDAMAGLVYACQTAGQAEAADAVLQTLDVYAGALRDPTCPAIARSCRARLSIMRESEQPAGWFQESAPVENMVWWIEVPVLTWCRELIFRETAESLEKAEAKLLQLLQLNGRNHNVLQRIGILVLSALCFQKQNRMDDALESLRLACALALPGAVIRPFAELGPAATDLLSRLKKRNGSNDFIDRVLDALRESGKTPTSGESRAAALAAMKTQPLVEPLSRRELETLDLLAQGLSKKEIADRLFISPETVKSHLKNVYEKLDVGNRRDAVAKAVDMGILPSS